jgi:hypothetical protein
MCLEFEDVREILLGAIVEVMAEIDQFNITYLAHIAHANAPERAFEAIRAEQVRDYNPTLRKVEITVSNDIREILAHPFKPPPVRIAQPILWAGRGRPVEPAINGQNETERKPFSNWDSNGAVGRLSVNGANRNEQQTRPFQADDNTQTDTAT